MSYAHTQNFTSRQADSATAKKTLLERFKARPGPDAPIMRQRRAERQAVAEARLAREAEKAAADAELRRLAAIHAAERAEQERLAEVTRERERQAELAQIEAERPRKVLLEAVQYAQLRGAGRRR